VDALRKALTHARFLSIAWLVVVSPSAMAFTFADGTHADCIARGATVMEAEASPGDVVYQLGRVAIAAPTASGYRIVWNTNKLKTLPPEMHDFIFSTNVRMRDSRRLTNCGRTAPDSRKCDRRARRDLPWRRSWLRSTDPETLTGRIR